MKVLIVDDNKQIISILEAYAKKEGYQTVIARGFRCISKGKTRYYFIRCHDA